MFWRLEIPPPLPPLPATFPLIVLLLTVSVPVVGAFRIPPPPPPEALATLSLTVLLFSVSVPALAMPPPEPAALF